MVSILVPLGYVIFLLGSLAVFSRVWKRKQKAKGNREPWFPPHTTRDIYVSLLELNPPPSRPVLIGALIRRAITDVQRIMAVRDSKVALQTLLSKGQIGDDTWNHLLETEKELEAELLEVVGEANHFRPGWGNIIFAHASDMLQHEKNKKIYEVLEQDRVKARAKYSSPPPAYSPAPFVGIAASNPKKRTLPSSVPTSAQMPSSKPGTPVPPKIQPKATGTTPSGSAPKLAGQQQAGQAQKPLQPVQSAPQQGSANARTGSPMKSGATTPASNSPVKSLNGNNGAVSPAKGRVSPAKNGTPTPQAPSLQHTLSSMSTATVSSGVESDADDDADGGASHPGSSVTSPNKQTPSKKKKKGKKGKK